MTKKHYVCSGGCKTVSDKPGYCYVSNCYRHRNPLSECRCEDDEHEEFLYMNVPKDEEGNPLPLREIEKK